MSLPEPYLILESNPTGEPSLAWQRAMSQRDDEIEAASGKYNCCRIMRLSSGNFAVFAPYSADDGIDLIYLGDFSGAQAAILTAEQVDAAASRAHIAETGRLAGIMALVGAQAPPQTLGIVRRA